LSWFQVRVDSWFRNSSRWGIRVLSLLPLRDLMPC
jgi:hypothetical protein